jgi:membrane associated rhomboid family serine protease
MHLLLGVVVIAIYGTTLLFGIAPQDGISWQGHLFGAVGGVVAAWLLDSRKPAPAKAAAQPSPYAGL